MNGIAFAGDYLSAASFLGICGMIAIYGYDGFLYSIGYLAGWVVALFVVAEPMTICPQCGKPAGEGKFCNNCGASLTMAKCPKCGAQNSAASRFCGECGTRMV